MDRVAGDRRGHSFPHELALGCIGGSTSSLVFVEDERAQPAPLAAVILTKRIRSKRMQKREVCSIELNWDGKRKAARWEVYLFTPDGTKVIARSEEFPWKESISYTGVVQKRKLIARLALNSWEPMPVYHGVISDIAQTAWYFKRPVPPDPAQEAE
jgi:hypothetical protein